MERVLAPQHRHVGRIGAGLERAVEPSEPVGQQLLAADANVGEPGRPGEAREVARGRRRGCRPPPRGSWSPAVRRAVAGRRWQRRRRRPRARAATAGASATAPRLGSAASRSPNREGSPANTIHPPGLSTRWNSAKARSRSGRWCRTAWPSTRSKLCVGERAAPRHRPGRSGHRQPEPLRVGAAASGTIPGRDVGAGGVADDAGAQQVEAEVAGAGADLERPLEAAVERPDRAPCGACRGPEPGRPRRSRCPTWSRSVAAATSW